jgi:hypothetical protein
MKNYQAVAYASTTRIGNMPNWVLGSTTTGQSSGQIYHTRFIAERDFTVSNLSFLVGATASASLTAARFGIYTRSGSTFTLVARTASDTTIGNTINTRYTRALDTTGGYPATYNFVTGSEYWVSFIFVGTTMPSLSFGIAGGTVHTNAFGAFSYTQTGQTDLIASSTGTANNSRPYVEVS